ncbi:sulfatase [Aureibaculum conchae]|uniref:sulfatase n=1 Tax=Aureibaculum sp. 2308TA14-22 TaxID=3108392 RepID=UPI003398960D
MNFKSASKKLLCCCLILVLSSCGNNQKKDEPTVQASKQPNVVFIAVDDLRPELGSYGNAVVKSPNIDKLASEGMVFTNHYVQVPTCGASRFSLLTGLRPKKKSHLSNNVFVAEIANKQESELPESFVHQLKRNGYYTVGIGKISHSVDGLVYGYEETPSTKKEMPYSWDEFLFDSGIWKTGWNAFFGYADGENRQSLKKQVKPYEAGKVDDDGYPDGLTANLAIAKLKELKNKEQPFFLGVGFFKPHLPFNAPKKYWDLYDREEIPLSTNPYIPKGVDLESLQNSGEFKSYQLSDEKPSLNNQLSDDYAKKINHAYYAAVSYVDAQIGKVLNQIKSLNLDQNTIIILWGDHGWHLGDHLVWGKHTLFERALKSPLIIKVPNRKSGKTLTIKETVDIYPTILELCNINLPHNVDGESFATIFEKDKDMNKDDVAYSYFKNGISMRTQQYRLTKYYRKQKPVVELYDHENDSLETKNIAKENPKVVQELLPLLEQGNTGLYK